jgi:hypothetical protein
MEHPPADPELRSLSCSSQLRFRFISLRPAHVLLKMSFAKDDAQPSRMRRADPQRSGAAHLLSSEPDEVAGGTGQSATDPAAADPNARRARRALPDFYCGSVTTDELNRPRRSATDFSIEQLEDISSVNDYFAKRRATLNKADPDDTHGSALYGSANRPQFGDEFAADWRELLPDDHPQRQIGPPLAIAGTPEADATLVAAHSALLAAMRSTSPPSC